jgi:ATPase subunit of ABC transporter with duplicated ATPase domains
MTHVKAAQDAVRAAEDAMEKGDPNAAATLVAANDAFEAVGGNTVERRVSDVLTGLGFAKEAWDRPCAALSGGWQMRVALARLLLSPAGDSQNSGITGGFLLLDEPTNHLDAQAKEWLAGWLRAYTGTVLLVSHDEALLDRGVDRLVEVRGSRLHGYSGNYQKFLEERKKNREVAARAASKEAAKAAKLEQFVAKNSARASTAKAAKSKAKQLQGVLENLEELEEATGGGERTRFGPRGRQARHVPSPRPARRRQGGSHPGQRGGRVRHGARAAHHERCDQGEPRRSLAHRRAQRRGQVHAASNARR